MSATAFEPFPKLARLSRECVITEKLDGTNAQVLIRKHEGNTAFGREFGVEAVLEGQAYELFAGSRTRLIKPGKQTDNFGFAGWVRDNAQELVKLGEGRHFGEWYGKGIQRGYGLSEKRFALFNSYLWKDERPSCCDVVPVLYEGFFSTEAADDALIRLGYHGSYAVTGFMNPEGIVVYHTHAKVSFKKTFDDRHKEAA